MNAKMEMDELKNRLMRSVGKWADGRIDDFVVSNPRMKTASVYMKRGVKNYLAKENKAISGMIDGVSLFLCDENGCVDADMVFNDLMAMFNESDEVPFGAGFLRGAIGKGVIRFQLPDNPIMTLLFGNSQAIKITSADFMELKDMIAKE